MAQRPPMMISQTDALSRKLAGFTFPLDAPEPTDLVLVPESEPLEGGLALARALAAEGKQVRLFAHGASLELRLNPIAKVAGSELGALLTMDLGSHTRPIRESIRKLVDGAFGSTLFEGRAVDVFYSSACARFFQAYIYAYPTWVGLQSAFPNARLHCAGPWLGRNFEPARRVALASRMTSALLPVASIAMMVPALLSVWSARQRATPVPATPESERPRLWVGLITDWLRINAHVIESVGLPGLAHGVPLGVLLLGTLERGARKEDMSSGPRDDLSGLGRLRDNVERLHLHQSVFPRSRARTVRAVAVALRASLLASARIARTPALDLPHGRVRVDFPLFSAAKFFSIDVLRAELAWEAAQELSLPSRSRVVFAANGSPALTAVDVALQARGVETLHVFHGGLGDEWVGAAEHPSKLHLAWTQNDARCLRSIRTGVLTGGMPVRVQHRARPPSPLRMLVMTSYEHRDYQGLRNFKAFEDEMMRFMELSRASPSTANLGVLWRPHPATIEASLQVRHRKLAAHGVELSRGRSLQEDVASADLIVTNMSTVVAECALSGQPVFVHLMPIHSGAPGSDFVHARRGFFTAQQGHALLCDHLARRQAGDEDCEPERFCCRALWGEAEAPADLPLWDLATELGAGSGPEAGMP